VSVHAREWSRRRDYPPLLALTTMAWQAVLMIVIRTIEVSLGRGGGTRHLHHKPGVSLSACDGGEIGSTGKTTRRTRSVRVAPHAAKLANANDNSPVTALKLAA
jgi:hypothetical protein